MIIYLYIKQHSITELKYFGFTKNNPFEYGGSGKYWQKHIKKHGKEWVKTLEVWGFDDQKMCTEFALKFSEQNNIVESKQWANLVIEDALNGNPGLFNNRIGTKHTAESKKKMSESAKTRKRCPLSEETKKKLSEAAKRRKRSPLSEETKNKLSKLHLGKPRSEEVKLKISKSKQNRIYINNGIITRCINKNDLEIYLSSGFIVGRLDQTVK